MSLATVVFAALGLSSRAGGALPQQAGLVDLLTQANVRIDGAAANDLAGVSVAAAGDVNGDGRADAIVGADRADNNSRTDSGSAYVIYGQAASSNVDLLALGTAGFRIDGAAAGDNAGSSVAGAGDVNGDGRADVIVGARAADNNSRTDSGSASIIFGFGAPQAVYGPLQGTVGQPIAAQSPTSVRRTGTASFTATGLPAGLAIDPPSGQISGTPTQAGSGSATVTMSDLAGSVQIAVPFTIGAAAVPTCDGRPATIVGTPETTSLSEPQAPTSSPPWEETTG